MKRNLHLETMMTPTIEAYGCELVGIENVTEGTHNIMRVYIDKEGGVKVEDLSQVSSQLSSLLDVEMPDADRFYLEVSSPGLDRILFTMDHFKKVIGKKVNIKVQAPINGRRQFKGKLLGVMEASPSGAGIVDSLSSGVDCVLVEVSGKDNVLEKVEIPFMDIDKARVIAEI